MSEWDRIVEERKEDDLDLENSRIINAMLRGSMTPKLDDVVRSMQNKYSKYGRNYERLLQDMCIPEAVSSNETKEKG